MLRPAEESVVDALCRDMRLHPAVARALVARGIGDAGAVQPFLDPRLASLRDPFELQDMDAAVSVILHLCQIWAE